MKYVTVLVIAVSLMLVSTASANKGGIQPQAPAGAEFAAEACIDSQLVVHATGTWSKVEIDQVRFTFWGTHPIYGAGFWVDEVVVLLPEPQKQGPVSISQLPIGTVTNGVAADTFAVSFYSPKGWAKYASDDSGLEVLPLPSCTSTG